MDDERHRTQVLTVFLGSNHSRQNTGVVLVAKHDMKTTATAVAIHHGSESEETPSVVVWLTVLTPSEQAAVGAYYF